MRSLWGVLLLLAFIIGGVGSPACASHAVPEQVFQAGPVHSDDIQIRHVFFGKIEDGRICSETGECFPLAIGVLLPQVPERRGRIIAELKLRDGKVVEVRFR
jgi:hypothetical protein